jgi:hypothetical protein
MATEKDSEISDRSIFNSNSHLNYFVSNSILSKSIIPSKSNLNFSKNESNITSNYEIKITKNLKKNSIDMSSLFKQKSQKTNKMNFLNVESIKEENLNSESDKKNKFSLKNKKVTLDKRSTKCPLTLIEAIGRLELNNENNLLQIPNSGNKKVLFHLVVNQSYPLLNSRITPI